MKPKKKNNNNNSRVEEFGDMGHYEVPKEHLSHNDIISKLDTIKANELKTEIKRKEVVFPIVLIEADERYLNF